MLALAGAVSANSGLRNMSESKGKQRCKRAFFFFMFFIVFLFDSFSFVFFFSFLFKTGAEGGGLSKGRGKPLGASGCRNPVNLVKSQKK